VLPTVLTTAGARFESVVAYENHDVDQLSDADRAAFESGAIDWVAISSPSIARNFARLLTPAGKCRLGSPTRIAAISPVTAEAARAAGLPVDVVASEFTWDGLLQTIAQAPRNANAGRGLLDSGVRTGDVRST
ncbi:MAG TPA: uroporphyrinogen-III synthase, partial [Planctomycetaceae bacterium]|nr:uroporphyrinogen-III synthase [Planctomycetaceae bacterium]